jgi:thiol-disulfide isomerase/thioredoxin
MPVESTTTTITGVPEYVLPDIAGKLHNLRNLTSGQVSVIFFSCNHCPYVQWLEQDVGHLSREFPDVIFVAVCSNDVDTYPEDDIPGLQQQCDRAHWDFPYLVDSTQELAITFGAVCTPDFFVFDPAGMLVYRGAADDSRPSGNHPVTGEFLRKAIINAKANKKFPGGRPSLGCGIKWRDN